MVIINEDEKDKRTVGAKWLNRKWKVSRSVQECAEAEMTLQGTDKKSKVRRITQMYGSQEQCGQEGEEEHEHEEVSQKETRKRVVKSMIGLGKTNKLG